MGNKTSKCMRNIVLTCLLLVSSYSFAVTAYPDVLFHQQPDGSTLSLRLCGDEFFNYATTVDGYSLLEVNGGYEYATLSTKGFLISLGVQAHNPDQRSVDEWSLLNQIGSNLISEKNIANYRADRAKVREGLFEDRAPNGVRGFYKALVILVEFPTQRFVTPNSAQQFSNLLNQKGYTDNGATGSAADYFEASTAGLFQPQFDVVGPYTLPYDYAYYGANVSGNDGRPRDMIKHACEAANADVDFKKYDADANGNVDNVFVIFAGYNEAEGGGASTIWPHHWNLAPKLSVDGVKVYNYACTSELRGNSDAQMCGIGTFVHEFSHVLGLPDLYTTNGASHYTLGNWDIMDRGPYNNNGRTPPSYSAYERFYLGYLTPKQLSRSQLTVIEPLIVSNEAYLVASARHNLIPTNPNPLQFYLLENRQPIGWDSLALPGHGLIITRIKYNATRWSNNAVNNYATDMGVDIIEADQDAINLAGDPFPGVQRVDEFDNFIGVDYELSTIIEQDSVIIFKFLEDDDDDISNVAVSEPRLIFETEQLTPSPIQSVVVASTAVDDNLELSFEMGDYFQMRTKDTDWSTEKIMITPEAGKSAIVQRVDIRYLPTVPSDEFGHSDYVNVTNYEHTTDINLIGYASPVELAVPVALNPVEVTSNSFVARWQSVKGATAYYLQLEPINETHQQSYHHFDYQSATICVRDTFYYASDLTSLTSYYYQVSATNSVNVDEPDYVTEPSNLIEVETLKDVASAIEGVVYDGDGLVITASEPIYIYNAQGQLWTVIEPNATTQYMTLPHGQVYLVRSGDKYIKVFF